MRSIMMLLLYFLYISSLTAKVINEDTSSENSFFRNVSMTNEATRDSALAQTRKNYTEAKEQNNKKHIADAAWLLGTDASHQGKYDSADHYYKESADYYNMLGLKDKVLDAYRMLGTNEGLQSHSAHALRWFLKAQQLAGQLKNNKQLAEINYLIGIIYIQVDDTENAMTYETAALHYALRTKEHRMQIAVYINLGIIYAQTGKSDMALNALRSAYILAQTTEDKKLIPEIYYNIGNIYLKKGELDSADFYLTASLKQLEQTNYPIGIATVKYTLAEVVFKQNKLPMALSYATESNCISTVLKDTALIHSNAVLLATIYRRLGDYKRSSELFENAVMLDNTLKSLEEVKLVERINIEIERKKAAEEIAVLQAKMSVHEQQRNRALAVGGIFLLGTLIVVIGILIIQKKNNLLLEQQKELEDADKTKDKMFAIIAHDLRSPLNSIAGSFDLLKGNTLNTKDKELLQDELQRSTIATLNTLDNLLHWGAEQFKKEKVVAEAVCIRDIVDQNIHLLANVARQKSIRLKQDIDHSYFARFDKNQLAFIIRNLIANAIKFSHSGQTVVCSAVKRENRILVTVEDEGIGMSEELRKMIFGEKRRKSTTGTAGEKGVGLGISMVHEFLERNGGTINVESTEGKGSKFTINIPAY